MKKIGSLILFLVLAFLLSACAENSNKETSQKLPSDSSTESMVTMEDESAETEEHDETEEISGNHVLIAYFGRWGNTEFPDDVDASTSASIVIGRDGNLQGTTEYVADLAFWTPGNLFAVYFDEPDDDPEGLMILGHIISDMSVFDDMAGSVEMQIDFLSE